ncbi:DUF3365 domain-containing protein [Thermodesulfobacteriota bacterium]
MKKRYSSISLISLLSGIIWTVLLVGLLIWNMNNEKKQLFDVSTYQAQAFVQEIITTRYWNSTHGGVYVPVTEDTQPNPYLDVPDRDVMTVDGVALTKINPAYMTRQIGELASKRNFVGFQITSSNPIRPGNKPDSWEAKALKQFAAGLSEYSEFVDSDDGAKLFRYMAPLWVETPCLSCHAKQGYREGDLRGGISVSTRVEPILAFHQQQIRQLLFFHALIWLLGVLGIFAANYFLNQEQQKREAIISQLKNALSEVKTLSGLLPICASCKKIRDDKGYWNQIERYIRDRSEADFSHSICPECAKKLYPDLYEENGSE